MIPRESFKIVPPRIVYRSFSFKGVFQNYTIVHKGFGVWPVGVGLDLSCWCRVCFHLWSLSTQKYYAQNGNTFWVDRNSRDGHYGPCPDKITFEPDLFLNLFTIIKCTKSTDTVKTNLGMTKKFRIKFFHQKNFSAKKYFFGQKFFFRFGFVILEGPLFHPLNDFS